AIYFSSRLAPHSGLRDLAANYERITRTSSTGCLVWRACRRRSGRSHRRVPLHPGDGASEDFVAYVEGLSQTAASRAGNTICRSCDLNSGVCLYLKNTEELPDREVR